jgi:hypothetical protein
LSILQIRMLKLCKINWFSYGLSAAKW